MSYKSVSTAISAAWSITVPVKVVVEGCSFSWLLQIVMVPNVSGQCAAR